MNFDYYKDLYSLGLLVGLYLLALAIGAILFFSLRKKSKEKNEPIQKREDRDIGCESLCEGGFCFEVGKEIKIEQKQKRNNLIFSILFFSGISLALFSVFLFLINYKLTAFMLLIIGTALTTSVTKLITRRS